MATGLLDLVTHVRSHRAGLAVGGAADHDHAVEEVGDGRGVVDTDVLALDVFQGVDDDALQFS